MSNNPVPVTDADWNAWSRGKWPRPKKRKLMIHPITAEDWAQWAQERGKVMKW